jgi:hypothetical protein
MSRGRRSSRSQACRIVRRAGFRGGTPSRRCRGRDVRRSMLGGISGGQDQFGKGIFESRGRFEVITDFECQSKGHASHHPERMALIYRHHNDGQARLSRCNVVAGEVVWECERIQCQKASEDGEEGYHGCLDSRCSQKVGGSRSLEPEKRNGLRARRLRTVLEVSTVYFHSKRCKDRTGFSWQVEQQQPYLLSTNLGEGSMIR